MQGKIFETLLGTFVLLGALFFFFFAHHQIKGAHQSQKIYTLSGLFQSVEGLSKGAPVHMSGVPVGKVSLIRLNTNNFMAEVFFQVFESVKIPSDSNVVIRSQSLIGGKYLDIKPGNASDFFKPSSVILRTQSTLNLESMIGNFLFSSGGK